MASDLAICNAALAHLGEQTVGSLDESLEVGNRLIELCNQYYPIAKGEALESCDWSFARKRAALSADAAAPAFDWAYAHALPEDCVRVLEFRYGTSYDGRLENFELQGEQVLSDEQYVGALYTCDSSTPDGYSWSFVSAVAYRLAALLAGPAKGDTRASSRFMAEYERALVAAQYRDQSQDKSNDMEVDRRRGQMYKRHGYGVANPQ